MKRLHSAAREGAEKQVSFRGRVVGGYGGQKERERDYEGRRGWRHEGLKWRMSGEGDGEEGERKTKRRWSYIEEHEEVPMQRRAMTGERIQREEASEECYYGQ